MDADESNGKTQFKQFEHMGRNHEDEKRRIEIKKAGRFTGTKNAEVLRQQQPPDVDSRASEGCSRSPDNAEESDNQPAWKKEEDENTHAQNAHHSVSQMDRGNHVFQYSF